MNEKVCEGWVKLDECVRGVNVGINAAAKQSPNATYKTVGRPRYYQFQVRLRTWEFIHVWFCGYQNIHFFNIFMSDNQKLVRTTQHTSWVVCWTTQDFSLAAALWDVLPYGRVLSVNVRHCERWVKLGEYAGSDVGMRYCTDVSYVVDVCLCVLKDWGASHRINIGLINKLQWMDIYLSSFLKRHTAYVYNDHPSYCGQANAQFALKCQSLLNPFTD